MANIIVNNQFKLNGKLSIKRARDEDNNIQILGSLATHYYIEEIDKLETPRLIVNGIRVYEEVYGSEDFDILYNFTADTLNIKNDLSNLDVEQIKEIEKKLYSKNGYALTSILNTNKESEV